jgi:hypothetical protein
MSEYGYIPEAPTQSWGSNKGIFTPNDIYDLTRDDKFTDYGQLDLIETKTASSLTTPNYIDFSSIQSDVYDVHFFTWSMEGTNSNPMYIQFFESGTIESGSNYQYANQYGGTGGSFSDGERSNSATYIHLGTSKADAGGALTQGYVYLYNLGDSTKYSFATYQSIKEDYFRFGSGVMTQASDVNGIRFGKTGSTSYDILGASLYGIKAYS